MPLRPTQEVGELRNWTKRGSNTYYGRAYGHRLFKDGEEIVLIGKYKATDYHDYYLLKTHTTPKGSAWILYKDREKK